MKKLDYFLEALNAGLYKKKEWVISAFSIVKGEVKAMRYPYELVSTDDGHFFYKDSDTLVKLVDAEPKNPAFRFKDKIDLKAGAIKNLTKDVTTTYGNLLFNQSVLVHAFGDKLDYMEGEVKVSRIEKLIAPRLTDNPPKGSTDPLDPSKIYVFELIKYTDAIFALSGYTQLCVPSATPMTMITDPKIRETRNKLLEKHKDKLNDPATIAAIEKELVDMDRAWIAKDPDKGFYIKDKSFDVARKRMYIIHGGEQGFGDGTTLDLVKNSLEEGWDTNKMPSMVNSLREGSYNRGKQTALGGEAVKFLGRVFQNTAIVEDDCGSVLGLTHPIDEGNYKDYIGFYQLKNGQSYELTEEELKKSIGKTLNMRSPLYCRTPRTGFCVKCMGKPNALNPTSLGLLAADVGSTFLYLFMKAMHGKKLSTVKYDLKTSIR